MFTMFTVNLRPILYKEFVKPLRHFGRNCTCTGKIFLKLNENGRRFYGLGFSNVRFDKINVVKSNLLANNTKVHSLQARCNTTQQGKKSFIFITWKSFLFSLGCGTIFVCYILYLRKIKREERDKHNIRHIGKAKMGGEFELVDQFNKPVKSMDLLGKWLLVYFGFTHCPDVCPDEIEKLVNALKIVDSHVDKKDMVKPVFISVDPERDSPSAVGKYVREFSTKILGLTGTREQVEKACKAYRVYYSAGPRDSDNDYIVDHTIITYFIGPDGEFIDYFNQATTAENMASTILEHMGKHEWFKPKGLIDKIKQIFE